MADPDEVKMCAGAIGNAAFEEMQDIFIRYNMTASEGVCCAADFVVWVVMTAFIRKEDAKKQMEAMVPGMVASIEANWDALQARREVLQALDAGESGGRMQ